VRILVDIKNLALYGGGIAHWFTPLLAAWITHRPDVRFLLAGPHFNTDFLPDSGNWELVPLSWPKWLPRPLRHPWYDNVLFPRAVSRLRPDLVMSPYHDVRMPKGVPSVISVHDLCLDELDTIYPRRIRTYYLALLRHNLQRAACVITVSETSRKKLIERYGVEPDRLEVVYNTPPAAFERSAETAAIDCFRRRYCSAGRLLFYPGGSEHRKNVMRLIQAFFKLAQRDTDLTLLVTGNSDQRWGTVLNELPDALRQRVVFAGRLNDIELRLAYAAADAVVYPSLCEGFGRVCLEAMDTGTPLACSDLPVMREVAGDYAHYFDPHDVESICRAADAALSEGHRSPVKDVRFQASSVKASFLFAMDRFPKAGL
jgi:glycosyltransferase involved in cell wall biosynthesis